MNPKQTLTFALTFFAYAGLHSLREGWSLSKAKIKDIQQLKADKGFLGLVDTCYLLSYSFGMMTLGNLIHRVQLKYFISIGMLLATIFYVLVPIYFQISGQFNHAAVITFMCMNGFFQCTGWPGVVGVMGNWFQKGRTGLILGIWSINSNIGNIIAQIICNILQQQVKVSWTYNFYSTGLFNGLVAVLIILFLKDRPQQKAPIQVPLKGQDNMLAHQGPASTHQQSIQAHQKPVQTHQGPMPPHQESILSSESYVQEQRIRKENIKIQQQIKKAKGNIFRALCFPKVPSYVIGYAMLKGCIYGLLFWLPTYLSQKNLQSQNGYIAAMVDTGSFIGGLVIGYLGDKYKYRALFLSPLLFVSSIVMFCSAYFLTDIAWQYYLSMFLVGITIGGPYNIIGTVITIDLGKQSKQLGGNTAAISALIQGTAAIFAAGSQLLLGALSQTLTFYVFFAECIVAAIVLFPLFLEQWKIYRNPQDHTKIPKLQEQK